LNPRNLCKGAANGYEVAYGARPSRKGENYLKNVISSFGYYLINNISEIPIPTETGDFRIISVRVIEELRNLNESHALLRGLVAYVGFYQSSVSYD